MVAIKMPSTPRSAYNPKRPPNALLLTQVRELEKAVAEAGRGIRRKKPKTEEQVAAYTRHLNRALHQQVLLPPMHRRTLDVPLDDLAPVASRTKSPTPKRATSSRRGKTKRPPARKRKRSPR
jgi:hypothetical protein